MSVSEYSNQIACADTVVYLTPAPYIYFLLKSLPSDVIFNSISGLLRQIRAIGRNL